MFRKLIAGAVASLLVGGGLAVATALPASAHTPEVTATCNSISATLTNYEYVPGKPAEFKTVVVTPAVPEVVGVPAVYGPTLFEYAHADNGNGNSNKTRWEVEGWNAGDNGKGWVPTGNTQPGALITPEVVAVAAVPEVTAQVEVKPAVAEQKNSITLVLDNVVVGTEYFGTSYQGSYAIDGTKGHSYSVVIDAIGSAYDKTISGKTTACKPTDITLPALTVVPPTCDTDGTLPFLNNPPAQNPNGYEFPGQGFRVYLSPAFTGPGTYTATLQKVGPGFDPAFPYGTKIVGGQTAQTLVVEGKTGFQGTDPEAPCYVAVPPTETTYGEWSTPVIDCDTEVGAELAITRENTVVTYTLDTVTGQVSSSSETVTERDVHIVTQAEVDAVECPLPPVTPEEPTTPATPEEPVTPVLAVVPMGGDEGILAQTGGTVSPLLWAGGGLSLLLGAALAALAAARRRQDA